MCPPAIKATYHLYVAGWFTDCRVFNFNARGLGAAAPDLRLFQSLRREHALELGRGRAYRHRPRRPGNCQNDRSRFRLRRQHRCRDTFRASVIDPAPASGVPNACPSASGTKVNGLLKVTIGERVFNVGIDMSPAQAVPWRLLLLAAAHF